MTLDLDAIQADIDRYGGTNREQGTALVAELRVERQQRANWTERAIALERERDAAHAEVNRLDAELRAARGFRPLVEWMARQACVCEQPALPVTGGPPCQFCDARVALAAYDKTVGAVGS